MPDSDSFRDFVWNDRINDICFAEIPYDFFVSLNPTLNCDRMNLSDQVGLSLLLRGWRI